MGKKGRHSNEFMRTSFANSGRIAGDGMLSDDYSEASMGGYYNKYPSPKISQYTKKEWEELTKEQPVKAYKLEREGNDTEGNIIQRSKSKQQRKDDFTT